MKPVDQEFVHKPEAGQYGDCQRAVIASLLELPITEVPHFLALAKNDAGHYWDQLQAFLRFRGMAYLTMPARCGALFFGDIGDVFHEISGPSPRGNGVGHAVVGCNGQIVFDPHPSRAGLSGDPAKWEHSYLVVAQPVPAEGDAKDASRLDWLVAQGLITAYPVKYRHGNFTELKFGSGIAVEKVFTSEVRQTIDAAIASQKGLK